MFKSHNHSSQLLTCGRDVTVTLDPVPPAAWRPAPSSAGLGPGGDPPALSSDLTRMKS